MRSDVTLVTVLALAGSIGKPPHYTIINHLIAPHSAAFEFALLACPACLSLLLEDSIAIWHQFVCVRNGSNSKEKNEKTSASQQQANGFGQSWSLSSSVSSINCEIATFHGSGATGKVHLSCLYVCEPKWISSF